MSGHFWWKIRCHSDGDSDLIRTVIPGAFGHLWAVNRNNISKVVGEPFSILFYSEYLLMFFTNVRRRLNHHAEENANV